MKTNFILSFALLLLITIESVIGQDCTNCDNTTPSGQFSSAIGIRTKAQGDASLASGYYSEASGYASLASGSHSKAVGYAAFACGSYTDAIGSNSTSIGMRNISSGIHTITLGTYLHSKYSHGITIGSGYGLGNELINSNAYSLMIGFNSTKPTFFVSTSPSQNKTGKVAIGNVINGNGFMDPQAKLHIRSDDGEAAAIFVEPNKWMTGGSASLFLGDMLHSVNAQFDIGLIFRTGNNSVFPDGNVGIGLYNPLYTLHVAGDINFTGQLLFKGQPIQGSPWEQVGTSTNITFLNGKVGIGSTNFVGDYGLYVNDGILTSEVMIKDPSQWFDFVFEENFALMPLTELEDYINKNSHLPDVPSEKEVKENGYSLTEMNGVLLKKVEELTLYIIEQQKMIEDQSTRLHALETKGTSN